jgi:hypothetical protein
MFSASMTIGASATTRGSTAAVSQVVQPLFEPPVSVKRSSGAPHSRSLAALLASNARTTLLTIGSSNVARCEVTLERVCDEPILGHAEQRLVRHLSQHDDGSPQEARDRDEELGVLGKGLLARSCFVFFAPPPSADDEHGVALVADAVGPHEQELVLPHLASPGLRLEMELDDIGVRIRVAALNPPRETPVALGDERGESIGIPAAPFLAR